MRRLTALALCALLSTLASTAASASEGGAAVLSSKPAKKQKQLAGGARPVGELYKDINRNLLPGGARRVEDLYRNMKHSDEGGAAVMGGAAVLR
jgi:hypothetical protein